MNIYVLAGYLWNLILPHNQLTFPPCVWAGEKTETAQPGRQEGSSWTYRRPNPYDQQGWAQDVQEHNQKGFDRGQSHPVAYPIAVQKPATSRHSKLFTSTQENRKSKLKNGWTTHSPLQHCNIYWYGIE